MVLLASAYDKSKYLKASDLDHEKKFRIRTATEETVGADRDKEKKLVVWFTNDERGLVLNRVNNRNLRGAFGDAVDGWAGKIIVVFPTMVDFRGKMGPALRVRIPPPKQGGATASAPQPTSPSGNGAAASAPASGNGAAAAPAVPPAQKPEPVTDPELADDLKPTLAEELNDELDF
jgi:hypothetical protein